MERTVEERKPCTNDVTHQRTLSRLPYIYCLAFLSFHLFFNELKDSDHRRHFSTKPKTSIRLISIPPSSPSMIHSYPSLVVAVVVVAAIVLTQ